MGGNAPVPSAARIVFISLTLLAWDIGLEPEHLTPAFAELHWCAGREFMIDQHGFQVRLDRVPDFVGFLSVNNLVPAAQRLMRWLCSTSGLEKSPQGPIAQSKSRARAAWYQQGEMA